ncbi:MAG: lipoyl synthase [Bacteroidota bacterium]
MDPMNEAAPKPHLRKPEWLRIKLPRADEYSNIKAHLKELQLHTICESGNCPNQGECWSAKTATFMILGNTCTRNCRFCSVEQGTPLPPDCAEPQHIAEAAKRLELKHCVLTSVTRDDLADGGAEIWAQTIEALHTQCPGLTIETLIPDFNGKQDSLDKIIAAGPDIISHNLETVARLTPRIRIKAKYQLSLDVLKNISQAGIRSKSGIMLGLGETKEEIIETMNDVLQTGCKIITIGQYLQPARHCTPVERYVEPAEFEELGKIALDMGFEIAESGPLVRSSYHAEKHIKSRCR